LCPNISDLWSPGDDQAKALLGKDHLTDNAEKNQNKTVNFKLKISLLEFLDLQKVSQTTVSFPQRSRGYVLLATVF
jgi:hypothetical protein